MTGEDFTHCFDEEIGEEDEDKMSHIVLMKVIGARKRRKEDETKSELFFSRRH